MSSDSETANAGSSDSGSRRDSGRPDPDALLARMRAADAQARRGRLKIFFGANAGVGKTCAMLAAARAAQAQGRVVRIGVVETHGRSDTEAMAHDLARLPLRRLHYRGRELAEFDLDAALAFGRENPGCVLSIDELAHSNVAADGPASPEAAPGNRHPKRWQDVEELLGAGIDVWTTINVQHLESLNDIVAGITGIQVRETVPDRVFDQADEVVVVDLPPDELLLRLKQGKVYLPQQAERAAAHFFRKGNLLALRELALRRTADRVDDQMRAWRRDSAAQPVWPNREALLACVGSGEGAEKVVRSSARLAQQLEVPWHAVHVQTAAAAAMPDARRQRVLRALALAKELGAATATVSAPEAAAALVRYAREHNLLRLVVGRGAGAGIASLWPWRRGLAERIAADSDELKVLQVALPAKAAMEVLRRDPGAAAGPKPHPLRRDGNTRSGWLAYVGAFGSCVATTLVATPFVGLFELSSVVLVFLLAVVLSAVWFGRGPALLAAGSSVLLFNVFFVPPRFSLEVADERFVVTFVVMAIVGLVVGQLTAGLKFQAQAATERERRVRSLYEMSRDLGSALLAQQVAEVAARFLTAEFRAGSALFVADLREQLVPVGGASAQADPGVARWAFDHAQPAGPGTDTLPSSRCLMLPLKAPMRLRGVLAVEPPAARTWSPEERQLLDTCAALLAISLERIHYIEVAQSSTVQMESERLRNSLLSAISHDLRTPLAALVGLADTLRLTHPPSTAEQAEIADAMRDSAQRMNALVVQVLDMARLEAGAVKLNLQWLPIEEVVGSALASAAPALAAHPVRTALADDLPLVSLDAVLFERVFVNLLENAAKHTPPGTPVRIGARADSEQVTIRVEDRGPGLPRGREAQLFDKFERGHKEGSAGGVGLGLAIARAIVLAHGGRIRAESAGAGGGAAFAIVLPRGSPPAALAAATEPSPNQNPVR